jgi:hypothetical protein
VQVFKSVDHGATWSYVSTASTGRNNDKELMWIDTSPTSPFKDSIYLAWDVPGQGMRFTRSINGGVSWSPETILSTEPAIGAHLTTGPAGEIYVTWPATDASQILMAKSADGGASFQPPKLIATTTASYEMSVPAMCQRQALIYTAIGVDRSAGPRRGAIYVAWTDLDATDGEPGCAGISSPVHSRVFISSSSDGGTTWNTPHQVRTGSSVVVGDQFNQWIDVDQGNGNLHVMFYDTRDDPNRRKTNVYYLASKDGGLTWGDEVKVSSEQTDETAAGADGGNQYGDYNGIVAFRDVAFPSWTDRRLSSAITKEQIFTASIVRSDGEPSDSSKALVAETLNIGLSQPERLKAYPKEWEVQVPQGTLLDILSKHLAAEAVILPARDLEDRSPLPVWFRVYLRKRFPHLSTSGRYQYPRTAQSILQHLLTQPNSLGP